MSTKKPQPFQEWLEEKFITDIDPQCTKDNFEDRFDSWVSDMQYDDWTQLADEYGNFVVETMKSYFADMVGVE